MKRWLRRVFEVLAAVTATKTGTEILSDDCQDGL